MTNKQYSFTSYFDDFLIPHEGTKYEVVPGDDGGPTRYGLDSRTHPTLNLRKLSMGQAMEVYFNEYWLPVAADKLPGRLAWALTDCGVNCGRTTSIIWLQTILKNYGGYEKLVIDGRIGPKTIAAAKNITKDYGDVILPDSLIERRQDLYDALRRKKPQFYKGWTNRNKDLKVILDL